MSGASPHEALANDPAALLRAWLAERGRDRRDPIRAEQRRQYELLWEHWLAFLAKQQGRSANQVARSRGWLRPAARDIQLFLQSGRSEHSKANARLVGGTGGSERARRTRLTQGYSPTTKRRYWRVLQRIYEFALVAKKLAGDDVPNPFTPLADALKLRAEAPEGLVLSIPVWNAIPRVLGVTAQDPLTARNRAAVLLLMDAAITPGELLALPLRAVGRELFGTGTLRLEGPRKAQTRELRLCADTIAALQDWIEARARRFGPGGADDPVFVSEQGPALSRSQLYMIVANAVRSAERQAGVDAAAKPSPMALRNTRLVIRLRNGEAPSAVVKLAGLKNAAGLRHLEHAFSEPWRAYQTWPGVEESGP